MAKREEGDKFSLLIIDDEEAARYGMRRALEQFGYLVEEAESIDEARPLMAARTHDLLLLDVNLPGQSGLEFLQEMKVWKGAAPLVILITAHGSEKMAVEAMKAGAYDYLPKPFEVDDLRLAVKNALETIALRGESGTGKELVAREIHERSTGRRRGAFVAVNCAALPSELIESELFGHEKGAFTGAANRRRGKFEQADGGTLFLDEIGDMSANVQAKLLRALEERRIERLGGGAESIPVDVRIVSATHRPLEQEIEKGNFRADLFYRLRVVTVDIAPLRDRREEIKPASAVASAAAGGDAPSGGGDAALAVPFTADFREDRREFER